jgi:predicted nucleic acid-binding protein
VTLVDTNVLLDILSADALWASWSLGQLLRRSTEGPLLINEVIYAELSIRIDTEPELDAIIAEARTVSSWKGIQTIPSLRRHPHRRAPRFFHRGAC